MMKHKIGWVCLLFTSFHLGAQVPEMTQVAPVSPITYKQEDGKFRVLSFVKVKDVQTKRLKGSIDGVAAKIIPTEKADSVLVWLPMIGEPAVLRLSDGKKTVCEQTFSPLIPADWGYFKEGTIHIIQSSHQDIAWMDTPEYCREDRINQIILPALELMKKNPAFTFEMEQTLNLMEFLEAHPERKDELIRLYQEKRFGWGATYNQPYEGLSSGEQLVRQAYYGRKWIQENLPGCDDRVANNIDVPGRTWQMPQILAKSGIPNLFVSRMAEGLYDWYSPDGSKVLTFTPGNYGWASMIWKFFDQDAVTAFHKLHHRTQLWSDYFKKHQIPPHYAILMSCDATKPVDYQPVIDEWNKIADASDIPLPHLKASTAEAYFEAVRGENTQFEKIAGERPDLWLYIHGPAHYEATKYKREAAVLLPAAESFTTFAACLRNELSSYPRRAFDRAWMASIYPDHGLGGKNGEITDAIFEDSLKVGRDEGQKLLSDALQQITEEVNTQPDNYIVFNDLTWELGNGGIVSLYDKELGKELIHSSKFACGDVVELGYTGNGAGEFTRITDVTPGDIIPLSSFTSTWKVTEDGPLFTRFEQEQPTQHAVIRQTITFYHTYKKIDFDITLKDFDGEHNRQYRIAFPLNMMEERTIHYEVPMGVAQVGKDELDKQPGGWAWGGTYVHHPKDSHPREIQNFISASGNGFGFSMSSCVAVADWLDPSREMAVYPVLQGILLSSHKSCHGEGNWYHQKGTHSYKFSITSHPEGWKNGYPFGIASNHPFYIQKKVNKGGSLAAIHSFLQISDPFTALSLIKKADQDGNLIIRLTEMEGKDKEITVTLPFEVKQVI